MDDDNEYHPGHHECLPGMAARLTAERFVDMIEHHPELHDLLDPAVIARLVEEEL